MDEIIHGINAVFADTATKHDEKGTIRKRFVIAASMGACASLLHTL